MTQPVSYIGPKKQKKTYAEFEKEAPKLIEHEEEFKKQRQFHRSSVDYEILSAEEFHALFTMAKLARQKLATRLAFYHRAHLAIRSKEAWTRAWHVASGSSFRQALLLGMRSWSGWSAGDKKQAVQLKGGMSISFSTIRDKAQRAFVAKLKAVGVLASGVKPAELYLDTQTSLCVPSIEDFDQLIANPRPLMNWKDQVERGVMRIEQKIDVLFFSPPVEWIWEADDDVKGRREVARVLREKKDELKPILDWIYNRGKKT